MKLYFLVFLILSACGPEKEKKENIEVTDPAAVMIIAHSDNDDANNSNANNNSNGSNGSNDRNESNNNESFIQPGVMADFEMPVDSSWADHYYLSTDTQHHSQDNTPTLNFSNYPKGVVIHAYSDPACVDKVASLTVGSNPTRQSLSPLAAGTHTLSFKLRNPSTQEESKCATKILTHWFRPSVKIVEIVSSAYAYAALKEDGSVETWGSDETGGLTHHLQSELGSGIQKLYSNQRAFAAVKEGGSVVTWGDLGRGGDSSDVSSALSSGVLSIAYTQGAFAALKDNGSVVVWGHASEGGDSAGIDVSDVKTLYGNERAFAALKNDGSVITWGTPSYGGDSSKVYNVHTGSSAQTGTLANVSAIYARRNAFAAVKDDGTMVVWGGENGVSATGAGTGIGHVYATSDSFAALKIDTRSLIVMGPAKNDMQGVDFSQIKEVFSNQTHFSFIRGSNNAVEYMGSDSKFDSQKSKLTDIVTIVATHGAFAALKSDGTVYTWGDAGKGGDSSTVAPKLVAIKSVMASSRSFAALGNNGSVVTWGDDRFGGQSIAISDVIKSDVVQLFSNFNSFTALKSDGTFVSWGVNYNVPEMAIPAGIKQVVSTQKAFAAIKEDGSVFTWGDADYGGDSSAIASTLSSGVEKIVPTNSAFAALKAGAVHVWGDSLYGGDPSLTGAFLDSEIVSIVATYGAFAALNSEGAVKNWGMAAFGKSSFPNSNLTSGVTAIAASHNEFSAITPGGYAFWGGGGDYNASLSSDVIQIAATALSFFGLQSDGGIFHWDKTFPLLPTDLRSGGVEIFTHARGLAVLKSDGSLYPVQLTLNGSIPQEIVAPPDALKNALASGVQTVISSESSFAALKENGSVIAWGNRGSGGDVGKAQALLSSDVKSIHRSSRSFVAQKIDGSFVIWGRGEGYWPSKSSYANAKDWKINPTSACKYLYAIDKTGRLVPLEPPGFKSWQDARWD